MTIIAGDKRDVFDEIICAPLPKTLVRLTSCAAVAPGDNADKLIGFFSLNVRRGIPFFAQQLPAMSQHRFVVHTQQLNRGTTAWR